MLSRKRISTARGQVWEWLHSIWILWTFTFGFFNWIAFAYIGIRVRQPRWLLAAVFYAAPLGLAFVFGPYVSDSWLNAFIAAMVGLSVVSIVHAFLVRKEYLLRLDLIERESANVSVTSFGRNWELRHSLWVAWTFAIGLFSWVAFLYVAFRVRRLRWFLWGVVYLLPVAAFLFAPTKEIENFASGLGLVAWLVSAVHAFAIRNDYLVRLERRLQETAGEDSLVPHPFEAEYARRVTKLSSVETTRQGSHDPAPGVTEGYSEKAATHPTGDHAPSGTPSHGASSGSGEPDAGPQGKPPSAAPAEVQTGNPASDQTRRPVSANADIGFDGGQGVTRKAIAETYPLPIAYSWSLLEGLWDPRDRYREQLRHTENILAFLGSVSLSILNEEDYEKAQLDLRVPWQGGISFGAWKLIVQRCAKVFRGYRDHPLAADIRRLNIGSEDNGFGADAAALIRARNDFHHGRGPTMEEDVLAASNEAQVRLQRCMEALSFFIEYPVRLVQDFDVDRRNDDFILKCLRLEGDGPGFPQEKVSFPKALPRGDLVLDLGDANWAQLYPFVVASNCPHCRYRETYFIDRWDDRKGTVVLKSFERGHTEEKKEIAGTLASLAGAQQPGT